MITTPHRPENRKVISMDGFRPGRSLSPVRQAEAYWRALCDGTDGLPRRSQIDPRGLENILSQTFILERIAPGIARFRLAGHDLNDLAGMEVRGMPVSAFFTPAGRSQMAAVLEHVFDTPAVAELTLAQAGGTASFWARMILLPLRGDTGAVSRILGVLVCDGPVQAGTRPARFDIAETDLRRVDGRCSKARPHSEPAACGFAEDQAQMQTPAPHLRLVK